jgi:hypothetical protein
VADLDERQRSGTDAGGALLLLRRLATRPLTAALLLLACYASLAALTDTGGYLGTDTGTKVHTLEVMDREDDFSPDIGYWAEDLDPSGSVHPIHQTKRQPDGSWVGVTTLPMLELSKPLYEAGGYRAALLLPMLGGVGAAFAARAVALRVGGAGSGWWAYWVIGLGSPVLVYSLDLWEHSLGVACLLGAAACFLAVVDGRTPWLAVLAGAFVGAGAVMRQEALVYGFVMTAATCLVLLAGNRSLVRPVLTGVGTLAGFVVPWWANGLLESSLAGRSRTGRSASTASASVAGGASSSEVAERIEEGALTLVGLVPTSAALSVLLGLAIAGAVMVAWRAEGRGDRSFVLIALGAAAAVYVADALGGLGFVPGMLVAFPLAIGGLLTWRATTPNGRLVVVIAVASLPLVYAFQYLGGGAPQWGGRYTLTSAALLGIVALRHLGGARPLLLRGLVMLSFLVTGLGAAWLVERSHAVDSFFTEVERRAEPVVIARQAFLLREGGAAVVGERWLSPEDEVEFMRAVDIARATGERRFTVLEWENPAPPPQALPDDVREVSRAELEFVDTEVGLVTYEFVGELAG